jgi:transcriptional regulator with XRE-family HTH domain
MRPPSPEGREDDMTSKKNKPTASGPDHPSRPARTAEDLARYKAIRERFQREKPSLEALVSSGEYNEPLPMGEHLSIRQAVFALRKAREAARLSLADVAERTGIDKAALSRIETGQHPNPTVSTLCRYAHALGKRWKWVLEDEAQVLERRCAEPPHHNEGEAHVSNRMKIEAKLKEYLDRIADFRGRQDSGSYDSLTPNQRELHDTLKAWGARVIDLDEIKQRFANENGNIAGEIFPTDFCYNLVNMDDKANKFLYQCSWGKFQFVDFDWAGTTEVSWTLKPRVGTVTLGQLGTFKVGIYDNKKFRWELDFLQKKIEDLIQELCG